MSIVLRRKRAFVGLLALAAAAALIPASAASAGTATVSNACSNSVTSDYSQIEVTTTGDDGLTSVAPGGATTTTGLRQQGAVPGAIFVAGYNLGLLAQGPNAIPATVNTKIEATNTTQGVQTSSNQATTLTTVITDPDGSPGTGDETATDPTFTANYANMNWTAGASGTVDYRQNSIAAWPATDANNTLRIQAVIGGFLNVIFRCAPGTVTPPVPGTVALIDPAGSFASTNIVAPNQAPTANAGPDQTVASGTSVNLNGTGSFDSDGTIDSYNWTQTGGTSVTLSGANTATPSFTAPVGPATLTLQLQVCDGEPLCSTDTVVVNVNGPETNLTQDYAFAWADQPFTGSYEPSTFYSFNRAGIPMVIDRSGVGSYSVRFPSFEYFPGGGNVQVSQYGGGGGYCKIAFWTSNTANVRCFNAAGAASDQYFTVLFLKSPPGTTSTSYAWANFSASASYTPSTNYSYNPSGGAITATRISAGVYTMTWTGAGGFGIDGGHVKVTAYGGSNQRCKVGSWGPESVTVRCFDSGGAPVDSQYTVLYLRPDETDDALAFAWANDSVSAGYTPNAFYSFNSGNGSVTASRFGVGSYSMNFAGFGLQGIGGGHVQVTAYGLTDTRCGVSSWGSETVSVNCYNSVGAPVDSQYDVLYIRPIAAPEPGTLVMLMAGIAGLVVVERSRKRPDLS